MGNTIGYLFENVFHQKIESMPLNTFINVEEFNIGIESYNHLTNEVEYNRINKIIRKTDSKGYSVKGLNFDFVCSINHRMYVKIHNMSKGVYKEVSDIIELLKNNEVFTLNEHNEWVLITNILPTNSESKILDMEVNKVHNYFSDGVLSHNSYGDPNVTTGGKAWAYYARTRIQASVSKGVEELYGKHKFKLVKATFGHKDATVETAIYYGEGINKYRELIDMCIEKDIIKQGGSWFSYGETKLGQGKDSVVDLLQDNLELSEELENKLLEKYKENANT